MLFPLFLFHGMRNRCLWFVTLEAMHTCWERIAWWPVGQHFIHLNESTSYVTKVFFESKQIMQLCFCCWSVWKIKVMLLCSFQKTGLSQYVGQVYSSYAYDVENKGKRAFWTLRGPLQISCDLRQRVYRVYLRKTTLKYRGILTMGSAHQDSEIPAESIKFNV